MRDTAETMRGRYVPLNLTKVQRPHVSEALVSRPRLLEFLDSGLEAPVTLVSAPAGYGKSVLVSQWAEQHPGPCAWLSLDEGDGNLGVFLSYLVEAIEAAAPGVLKDTRELMTASESPSVSEIVANLSNEMGSFEEPIALVLDDYHRLDPSSPVHELIELLTRNPPRGLHLVIVTRHDPPLPANILWGGHTGTDVRLRDLRFNRSETADFLKETSGHTFSDEALSNLDRELEGWPIGLRLLSLELRHVGDPDAYVRELHDGLPRTQQYLLQEVLQRQPAEIRRCLLRSAILDRFCAGLLEAICVDDDSPSFDGGGSKFIALLHSGHFFTVAIDDRGRWFRYHHLFREFLKGRLEQECSTSEIEALHARAFAWFEAKGLVEEAIDHALLASQPNRAADLVARHRHLAIERHGWPVLERWLNRLPKSLREQRVDLLITRLFVLTEQYRLAEMSTLIERLEAWPEKGSLTGTMATELDLFAGLLRLWRDWDADAATKRFVSANKRGRYESNVIRSRVEFYIALASAVSGEAETAMSSFEAEIATVPEQEASLRARMLGSLAIVRLLSGDLVGAVRDGEQTIHAAAGHPLRDIETYGHYVKANAQFQAYQLSETAAEFEITAKKRAFLNRRFALDAAAGMAIAHQLLGQLDEADRAADELFASTRNSPLQYLAESCRARLALLRGNVREAEAWAEPFEGKLHPSDVFFFLEVPAVTRVRVLAASRTKANLNHALELLRPLQTTFRKLHFKAQLLDALILQAVALRELGWEDEARAALDEALSIAEPGGFVRPFVEPGTTMAEMLHRRRKQARDARYVERLLAAIEGRPAVATVPARSESPPRRLAEPLTHREIDILELLSKRLRDKEIAAELAIAPSTVHDHLKRIYGKLDAHNRREAVDRAKSLGIL